MLRTLARLAAGGLLLATVVVSHERPSLAQAVAGEMPVFEKDTSWPRLPNNWVLGAVAAVATDRRDHVWILHRPRLVPEAQRAQAAPSVLEYDAGGNFVRAWGGPSEAYEWPTSEHAITVDPKGNIWIGGNGVTDDMLLKFTGEGKFIMQVGKRGASTGNADTVNVNRPADLFVYPKTNELFVADGYGNRRLIVFDADTGKFKRMWGAFGKPPDSNPPAGAPGAGGRGRGDGAGCDAVMARAHPQLLAIQRRERVAVAAVDAARRTSIQKAPDRRRSPIPSTPSESRMTVWSMWAIAATGASRFSRSMASSSRKVGSIAVAPAAVRRQVSRSHPIRRSDSSTTRPSATRALPYSTARACRCSISSATAARPPRRL